MLTYRRVHHHHAKLAERREVEAGWAQVRADPLRLGNRAEALGNAGRGGGAEPERRRRRATSGGVANVVDFQCWNLQVVVEKRQSCKNGSPRSARAPSAGALSGGSARPQHRCAPRSMHASFVTCGQYRVSGTGSTEKSAGAGGEESESFGASTKRGASGSTSSSPVSGTEADTPGATRVPAVLQHSRYELLHEAEPRARVARCDAARRSRRPRTGVAKRRRRETNERLFFFQERILL